MVTSVLSPDGSSPVAGDDLVVCTGVGMLLFFGCMVFDLWGWWEGRGMH